jgi:hypothetical protein
MRNAFMLHFPIARLCLLIVVLRAPALADAEPGISQILPALEIPAKLMPAVVDMDADGDLDVVFPGCRYGPAENGIPEDGPMGLWIENLGQRNFAPPRIAYLRHDESGRRDTGYTLGDFTASPGLEILVTETVTGYGSAGQLWQPVAIQPARPGGGATREVLAPNDPFTGGSWHGADLDGDGPAELLRFAYGDGGLTLTIWQRDPGGGFAVAGSGMALDGGHPSAITLADVDGDGDLDLIREEGESIRINERTDPRSFASTGKALTTGAEMGSWGDLDGDGLPEWFGLKGSAFKWLPNSGGLRFGAVQSRTLFPNETSPPLLAHEPVPGNGALLTFGTGYGGAMGRTIRFGTWAVVSEKPFALAANQGIAATGFFQAMADFDGDGRQDLLLRTYESVPSSSYAALFFRELVAWGTADGFAPPVFITPPPIHSQILVIGDFDRDGDADLIVGQDMAGGCHLLSNDGRGGFAQTDALAAINAPPGAPADTRLVNLQAADLSGDGISDLVLTYMRTSLAAPAALPSAVAIGRGDGTFVPPVVTSASFDSPTAPWGTGFTDWDGDGDLDWIGSTGWTENLGGVLSREWRPLVEGAMVPDIFGNPVMTAHSSTGDLDGDGFPDFIQDTYRWIKTGDFTGTTVMGVAYNDGLGGLASLNEVPAVFYTTDIFGNPTTPLGRSVVADLNADGLPDLCTVEAKGNDVFGNPLTQARWRRNPGGGSRSPGAWLSLALGSLFPPVGGASGLGSMPFPDSLVPTLDFNGDGVREWVAPGGYLRPDRKGPLLSLGYDFDGATGLVGQPYRGAADFDGDGDADFLIGDAKSGRLFLLENPQVNGHSRLVRAMLAAGVRGAVAGGNADADGDGWNNLTELAEGSDPLAAGSRPTGRFSVSLAARNGMPTVVFRRRMDAAVKGFEYRLEASDELGIWESVSLTGAVAGPPEGGWQEVAMAAQPLVTRRFYRLAAVELADE